MPAEPGRVELARILARTATLVDVALDRLLPEARTPPRRLHAAMRYAVFPGGKRIRPALTLLAYAAARPGKSKAIAPAIPAACAIELMHCFSLVHDDLPCLDDSPTRRGRPSVHRRFDESTALLAGDALLVLAFEVLARPWAALPGKARTAIALELARAAGANGMIGGQAAELDLAGRRPALATLESVHRRKTGGLFEAAAVMGGLAGGAPPRLIAILRRYARQLGLAFQIADDLLDHGADEGAKRAGHAGAGRPDTYPGLLGMEGARRALERARDAARREARHLGPQASGIAGDLADFVAGRQR